MRSLPGLSVGKPEKKMGQQGAHICDVIFDNVRVPVEDRLGECRYGDWTGRPLKELAQFRGRCARLRGPTL